MELVQEELVMGSKEYQSHTLKGKRTNPQRPVSPFVLTMATTSSSCSSADGGGGTGGGFGDSSHYSADRLATSPSPNSGDFTQSTTLDEEDMANCLILLAQGRRSQKSSESSAPATATITNKAGAAGGDDIYQCKTCSRCFPSFQALGGHRASHKKPKEEKKPNLVMMAKQENNVHFNDDNTTTLSLQIPSRSESSCSPNNNNKSSRVHECSICGAEFTSGQALGGHMRRHRPVPMVTTTFHHEDRSHSQQVKKPRTTLSLDLNLPAPEDDHRESKFPFASKEQVIVFSASPLVNCHY